MRLGVVMLVVRGGQDLPLGGHPTYYNRYLVAAFQTLRLLEHKDLRRLEPIQIKAPEIPTTIIMSQVDGTVLTNGKIAPRKEKFYCISAMCNHYRY